MTWSQNKWTVISALGTVFGVIIPVLIFFATRDSKELTVKTVSSAVVADLTEPALASFRLTYNDLVVTRLTAATIEVTNSGSRPIERNDFERDLVIGFGDPVLAATVAERVPEQIRPDLTLGSTNIAIKPLLLNPGDRFRLTVHLRGDFAEPSVDGRISGVPTIQRKVLNSGASRRSENIPMTQATSGFLALAGYFWLGGLLIGPLNARRSAAVPRKDGFLLMFVLGLAAITLLLTSSYGFEFSRLVRILVGFACLFLSVPLVLLGRLRGYRGMQRLREEIRGPSR